MQERSGIVRILVLGAGGFIGRVFADCAEAFGHAVDRNRENVFQLGWRESIANCDAVVYLAGIVGIREKPETYSAQMLLATEGLLNAIDIAKESGAYLLFPSTVAVHGPREQPYYGAMARAPYDHYTLCKSISEEIINYEMRNDGLRAGIIRLPVVYGPGQRLGMMVPNLVRTLLRGEEFAVCGDTQRTFLRVEDAASAMLAVITAGHVGAIDIGGPDVHSIHDVAEMACRIIGKGSVKAYSKLWKSNDLKSYRVDPSDARRVIPEWNPQKRLEDYFQEVRNAIVGN
jgi:nucleoside-diphosphate-sugar epimerase